RNVPPRDAARRTTSLRNARAAGDISAALTRLARTVRLKRLWLRDGHVKRNTCFATCRDRTPISARALIKKKVGTAGLVAATDSLFSDSHKGCYNFDFRAGVDDN